MTVFSNLPAVSDTVTFSGLSGIASGNAAANFSATSTSIDNTPTGPRSVSYLNGLLRLTFGTPLTAGAGAPYISLYLHPLPDGTTLPNPPGAAAALPRPNAFGLFAQLPPSLAYAVIDFGDPTNGFGLGPFLYGFQLNNVSGVTWSGTITAVLYRWNSQGV